LVRYIFIEYACALVEVLGGADEAFYVTAGVDPRVGIGFERGVKNQFLVRQLRRRRL
jgi:hypothetical protein